MGLPLLALAFFGIPERNHPMNSSQTLRGELLTLQRRLQAHHNQIEYHKSGANLLAALFNSNLRRQSLQAVANERRGIEQTLLQIQEVQEQHLVDLFLECWQDELSRLPDAVFLSITP
jgi:hypothetical protein